MPDQSDLTLPGSSRTRAVLRGLARGLLQTFAHLEVRGVENVPLAGPLLIACNHTSHLDAPTAVAFIPREIEFVALADLGEVPVTRTILRAYRVIWVHRDELDREVVKQSLAALDRGQALWLAPEAGRSPTGALMPARHGVAWLAARSGAPVLPMAIAGAHQAAAQWQRLRRPTIQVAFGQPMRLTVSPDLDAAGRRAAVAANTEALMRAIAALLPPEYRGVYQ